MGRSLAVAAATAVLAGLVPSIIPTPTATGLDNCGNAGTDYSGTFTGTVLQGDGPETLTYTITFLSGINEGFFTAQLTVSGVSGSYASQGTFEIHTVQGLGQPVLTLPHWHPANHVTYEEIRATRTACLTPGPAASSAVTSFAIRPMGDADVIMIQQS
ncbi:hypothetical protein ABZY81_41785 [Streptomyces sp. NPDC006514]|uniref:hypothetical protein n=1 Tax=Streptomyces sp. NPDC006514 TaxID=3154308 RepID=UPI0033B20029